MNDQELQQIEAELRTWKPRNPSPRLARRVFPQRRAADFAGRARKLAWLPSACTLGTAIASVLLLVWNPTAPTSDDGVGGTNALVATQLTENALLKLPGATLVNSWHTVTLATTNY